MSWTRKRRDDTAAITTHYPYLYNRTGKDEVCYLRDLDIWGERHIRENDLQEKRWLDGHGPSGTIYS